MKEMVKFDRWRERITSFTGKDTLRSSLCQREMKLVEVAYFSKRLGSLAFYHPPYLSLTYLSTHRTNTYV